MSKDGTGGTGGAVREPRAGEDRAAPEGCLAVAVRVPVRVVTLVLVLPFRLLWDALVACGRVLRRTVWRPFARGAQWCWYTLIAGPAGWLWRRVLAPVLYGVLVWPWVALWGYVLAPAGRAAWRYVLAPTGRGVWWLLSGTGRGLWWLARAVGHGLAVGAHGTGAGLAWLGRVLVVTPLTWLYARLLTPVGHGLGAVFTALGHGLARLGRYLVVVPAVALWTGFTWLLRMLLVVPAVALYRHVLTPLGHGIVAAVHGAGRLLGWLVRYAVVVPAVAVYRWVLTPVGRAVAVVVRETVEGLGHAWRAAGYVSRAVFRFAGRVLRWLFVDPAVWVWRHVVAPVGRAVREHVWRPSARAVRAAGRSAREVLAAARASVRETRAELRRALFGAPRVEEREALPREGRVP
ncbi:hypothetical protein ACWGJ2_37495 [Streptomyces sp. NPDC054796]